MSAEETLTNMNLTINQYMIDKITEKNWNFVDTVCMYSVTGITTTEVRV